MSYLEVFVVLTEVGVDVSKIFGVGAGAGVLAWSGSRVGV